MMIISWNLQKGFKPVNQLLKLFENHGADAVLIQEPSDALKSWGNSQGKQKTPRGCKGTWKAWKFEGGTQGTIVILTRDTTTVTGVLTQLGPFNLGQGTNMITEENPLVSGSLKKDKELISFATCHAPYDQSIVGSYATRGMEAVKRESVDVWMGDFNTYGITKPPESGTETYMLALASPTGAQGSGGALDKIVLLSKYANAHRCGRIIPSEPEMQIKSPARGAPSGNTVTDVKEGSWGKVPSDHLPVYIDINPDMEKRPVFEHFTRSKAPSKKRKVGMDPENWTAE